MTTIPFLEGKNPLDTPVRTYVSNSMNTSAVDPFRQGIELTQDKHFQQGIAKIWSGMPGHVVDLNQYGQRDDEIFPNQRYFEEIAKFNPVLYLTDYYSNQPVVIDSAVNTNEHGFDGIIEPLTIRKVIAFTSIDAPFEPHGTKANLESGNFNLFRNADQIISKYNFKEVSLGDHWYEDNVDMVGSIPTNLGFWPTITTRLLGFDDSQIRDGVILPISASLDMQEALKGMRPPTENYLPTNIFSTAASLYDYRDWIYPDPVKVT